MARDILQAIEASRKATEAREARASSVEIVSQGYQRRTREADVRRVDEQRRELRERLFSDE